MLNNKPDNDFNDLVSNMQTLYTDPLNNYVLCTCASGKKIYRLAIL